jgi:hypothetical protein
MHHCPRCTSEGVHHSRTRSKWESWRKAITGKRPYRCRDCRWRGWACDSGPQFSCDEIAFATGAVAADHPDPPNLKNTEFARARRGVDLTVLDETIPLRLDVVGEDSVGV